MFSVGKSRQQPLASLSHCLLVFSWHSRTTSRLWELEQPACIRVEQLECGPMNAPPGCLTYNMGISGSITSYNFNGGSGEMINNQKFSHCIKYQEGYCDIAMTCTKFDVGNDPGDSVTIGSNVLQGMNFGTNNMLNGN